MEPQSVELEKFPSPKLVKQEPLRVLLDARKLGDGGIGVYITNLICGLAVTEGIDLTVIVSGGRENLIPKNAKVKVLIDKAKSYSLDELFLMPRRIDFKNYDVFHTPHFPLPYGIPVPTVLTIHDTIHLTHPEKLFYPTIAKYLLRSSMQRAAGVVTVSQASKRSLISLCKDVVSKVRVIPNAIGPNLSTNNINNIGDESGLDFPYILAVFSNRKPHKGFNDLIEAFKAAQVSIGNMSLVLAGSGISTAHKDISENIKFVGEVTDTQLQNLYSGARFLVMPSMMEGFSLPVLEAKSQGTPIVSRPVPAVCELLDDNDYLCSDMSVAALSAGLVEGVRRFDSANKDRQSRTRIDSNDLLEKYSINNTTAQIIEVYRSVSCDSSIGVAK